MVRLLKGDAICERLEIEGNRVGIHVLHQISEVMGYQKCSLQTLNMSKQKSKQKKNDEDPIKKSVTLSGFF
jgi:hypothetical protein